MEVEPHRLPATAMKALAVAPAMFAPQRPLATASLLLAAVEAPADGLVALVELVAAPLLAQARRQLEQVAGEEPSWLVVLPALVRQPEMPTRA